MKLNWKPAKITKFELIKSVDYVKTSRTKWLIDLAKNEISVRKFYFLSPFLSMSIVYRAIHEIEII